MNILQLEDAVKGLPDARLMQEAQAPSGQLPQFLLLSEVQRRADMRKRYQAQQQEQPQGTVADQILQQGIGEIQRPPEGTEAPPAQMPIPTPTGEGIVPSGIPPMQPPNAELFPAEGGGYATGGLVRMAGGGEVGPNPTHEQRVYNLWLGQQGLSPQESLPFMRRHTQRNFEQKQGLSKIQVQGGNPYQPIIDKLAGFEEDYGWKTMPADIAGDMASDSINSYGAILSNSNALDDSPSAEFKPRPQLPDQGYTKEGTLDLSDISLPSIESGYDPVTGAKTGKLAWNKIGGDKEPPSSSIGLRTQLPPSELPPRPGGGITNNLSAEEKAAAQAAVNAGTDGAGVAIETDKGIAASMGEYSPDKLMAELMAQRGKYPETPEIDDLMKSRQQNAWGAALMQLGAGVAGGNLSKGLESAGNVMAKGAEGIDDIKLQHRMADYEMRRKNIDSDIATLTGVATLSEGHFRTLTEAEISRARMKIDAEIQRQESENEEIRNASYIVNTQLEGLASQSGITMEQLDKESRRLIRIYYPPQYVKMLEAREKLEAEREARAGKTSTSTRNPADFNQG